MDINGQAKLCFVRTDTLHAYAFARSIIMIVRGMRTCIIGIIMVVRGISMCITGIIMIVRGMSTCIL